MKVKEFLLDSFGDMCNAFETMSPEGQDLADKAKFVSLLQGAGFA